MIEPIRVKDDAVYILDQRALPHKREELLCHSADDVVAAIKSLAVRGAPAIGIAGLYGLWLEALRLRGQADFWDRLAEAKERLKLARPTAVNLAWAINRTWNGLSGVNVANVPEVLRQAADALASEERDRNSRIAQYGASLLAPKSRLLTHCNTGSLATVGVGTALGVIREGFSAGLVELVWVDETRPLLQGARLTAWELLEEQIPATLITDSMAASMMAKGLVDAVIVGADRICANGDTANKIGTYSLAVLAHYHGIPFYVAAPMSTIDLSLESGAAIPIEERSADEVRGVFGTPIAPTGMPVANPAFDVTPGPLIAAVITDRGIARAPYNVSLTALMEQELRKGDDMP